MGYRLKTLFTNSFLLILLLTNCPNWIFAQSAMINIDARNTTSLNGIWPVIIDPTGIGEWRQVWLEKKPAKRNDFPGTNASGLPKWVQ